MMNKVTRNTIPPSFQGNCHMHQLQCYIIDIKITTSPRFSCCFFLMCKRTDEQNFRALPPAVTSAGIPPPYVFNFDRVCKDMQAIYKTDLKSNLSILSKSDAPYLKLDEPNSRQIEICQYDALKYAQNIYRTWLIKIKRHCEEFKECVSLLRALLIKRA